jgi:hypothetical protein
VKEREDSDDSAIETAEQEANALGQAALEIIVAEISGRRYDETALCLQSAVPQIEKLITDKYGNWSNERRALLLIATVGEACKVFFKRMMFLRQLEQALNDTGHDQP